LAPKQFLDIIKIMDRMIIFYIYTGGDNVNGQNFTILFELQLESAILFHPFRLNKLQRGNKEIRNNKHNHLTTTITQSLNHSSTQALKQSITVSLVLSLTQIITHSRNKLLLTHASMHTYLYTHTYIYTQIHIHAPMQIIHAMLIRTLTYSYIHTYTYTRVE
jgi:hypothetical protein